MRISGLTEKHRGQELYIVGTGPSLRVFPVSFLADKLTLGLNEAWRYAPLTYSLTLTPKLVNDYAALPSSRQHQTTWITPAKAPLASLSLDDDRYYVFHGHDCVEDIVKQVPNLLFVSEAGVLVTALDLAARMEVKTIYLVGCDLNEVGGDHHGHDQPVRFLGKNPADVYRQTRYAVSGMRFIVREKFGIPVLSLSPLLGSGAATEDYLRLCDEHQLPKLPKPVDISPLSRKRKIT